MKFIISSLLLISTFAYAGQEILIMRSVKVSGVECADKNYQTRGQLTVSGTQVKKEDSVLQILADPAETESLCPVLQNFEKTATSIDIMYVYSDDGVPFMRGYILATKGYLAF